MHPHHPYESLTPDTVIDAVEAVGYLSDARIFPLNSYENRVYQVGIEEGEPLIGKFYRPDRWSQEQIREEHQFTLALAAADIPVVPPLQDAQGETLHHHQGFDFALFARRGGHAPELDNLDNLYVLGRTLGRIHQLGAAQDFKSRPTLSVEAFGHQSRDFLIAERWIPGPMAYEYQQLCESLFERVESRFRGVSGLRTLRLHGDCHPGNILWRDDAPHFVDFDDCRQGPAIQDLWMLISGDRHNQTIQMRELIEGYEEFRPFNRAELALIEPLRALRRLHYSAWLARRWQDPAFPLHFPWFNTEAYWHEQLLELRELNEAVVRDPLQLGP